LRNTTNPTYSFNGFISNVAVLQSALSASQVSTLFNFGTPETNTSFSPIHNWKLDNLTTGLNDTGSLASNNGTAGSVNGTGPVQESTPVAVVPSWKIPSALTVPTINYTSALSFDGGNRYINCGTGFGNALGNYSGDLTISLWLNRFSNANQKGIFYFGGFGNNRGILEVYGGGTGVSVLAGGTMNSGGLNELNTWYHLCIVYKAGDINNSKVYVNGQSQTTTTTGSYASSKNFSGNSTIIGGYYGPLYTFNGSISNAALFTSELSSPQVLSLYNDGQPESSISFSPTSWWKLNNLSNGLLDSGSSNNDGTNSGSSGTVKVDSNVYVGNVPVNGVSTTLPSTALQQSDLQFDSPYSNYSLYFDAVSDRISIPYVLPSGTTKFSVSIWGNISAMTGSVNKCLIAQQPTGGLTSEGFSIFTDGAYPNTNVWFKIENNTGTQTTSNIVIGEWFHILATYDSGTAKIYFNGILENTTTGITSPLTTANTTETIIGSLNPSGITIPMLGHLDETAIWDTVALTEAQVLEIYNNGRPGDLDNFSGTAPISWWRLGENAYFNTGTTPGPEFTVPNSIAGAPNGVGSGTVAATISAYAPGTYANGIGDGLAITDRVGDAPLSVANSQSYNMIPDDKVPYVPGYVGLQTTNASEMTFNGVDSFFDTGNIDLGINSTLSMWFKPGTSPAVNDYALIGEGSSNFDYVIRKQSGAFYVWVGSSISYSHNYGSAISANIDANGWNFLAIQKAGGTITVYLKNTNGEFEATATKSVWATTSMTFDRIGSRTISPPAQVFSGQIDEVAGFSEALTPDQIKFDLYKATTTGKTADIENNTNLPTPVAWYRMGD
jgi:hypothetical protein